MAPLRGHLGASINQTVICSPCVIVSLPQPSSFFLSRTLFLHLFILFPPDMHNNDPMPFVLISLSFTQTHTFNLLLFDTSYICVFFQTICISAVIICEQRQSFVLSRVLHLCSCSFVLSVLNLNCRMPWYAPTISYCTLLFPFYFTAILYYITIAFLQCPL